MFQQLTAEINRNICYIAFKKNKPRRNEENEEKKPDILGLSSSFDAVTFLRGEKLFLEIYSASSKNLFDQFAMHVR